MTDQMFEPPPAVEAKWEGASELRKYLVPVGSLTSFPDNPGRSEEHIYFIAQSLAKYGQVRAILTWENAEEFGLPANTIVGGHHVWLAAQSDHVEWTHVAAIPAHFKDYERAKNYLALDNLLSQRDRTEQGDQMGLLSADEQAAWHEPDTMDVADLKQHERSVRQDPDVVIEHMAALLKEVGFTEDVIVARDGTILAGESVLRAAAVAGIPRVQVRKVDIDPDSPEALRIMAASYASGKQAMVDDRAFADMLKDIQEDLDTLEGTGFDQEMLAGLLLATRTSAEIRDSSQAMEWLGLSEYESVPLPSKLVISFDSDEERELFMEKNGILKAHKRTVGTVSTWYPPRDRSDPGSLRFVDSTREKWQDDPEVARIEALRTQAEEPVEVTDPALAKMMDEAQKELS